LPHQKPSSAASVAEEMEDENEPCHQEPNKYQNTDSSAPHIGNKNKKTNGRWEQAVAD